MIHLKKFNQIYEKVTTENAPFQTTLSNIDIELDSRDIKRDLYDTYTAKCEIYWDYELETGRKSGIRGITPLIKDVVLTVDYDMYKEGTEDETETLTKTYEFSPENIETENSGELATIPYEPIEIVVYDNMEKIKIIF